MVDSYLSSDIQKECDAIKQFLDDSKKEEIKLSEPFEEFIKETNDNNNFIELFQAGKKDIDLKSDIINEEAFLLACAKQIDKYLYERLHYKNYYFFIDKLLRLKVSKDRLSRSEFVNVNKKERFEDNLIKFNQFKQLMDNKQ